MAILPDRWGCTIFYVDTNGIYVPVGPQMNNFQWMLLQGSIWKQVQARHPDVLLVPELRNDNWGFRAAMWAYTAPYEQLDYTKRLNTPDFVRKIYPDAFVVNYIANCKEADLANWAPGLVDAVKNKDVLMSRGWFSCAINRWVIAAYNMAYQLKQEAYELEFEPLLDAVIEKPAEMLSDEIKLIYQDPDELESAAKRLQDAATFFKNARAK